MARRIELAWRRRKGHLLDGQKLDGVDWVGIPDGWCGLYGLVVGVWQSDVTGPASQRSGPVDHGLDEWAGCMEWLDTRA